MQTGITIPDIVKEEFQAMRMKRKHRYIIYKATEGLDSVEIERCGERAETWEEFKEHMPKNNSR